MSGGYANHHWVQNWCKDERRECTRMAQSIQGQDMAILGGGHQLVSTWIRSAGALYEAMTINLDGQHRNVVVSRPASIPPCSTFLAEFSYCVFRGSATVH